MAQPLLMFTWNDVRRALETFAETPQQRRAAWLLERLKQDSPGLSPAELLTEIISLAILLGGEHPQPARGLQSLLDGLDG